MAPQAVSTTVKNNQQPTGPPDAPKAPTVQPSSTSTDSTSRPVCTKRKCLRDFETDLKGARSSKRPRRFPPLEYEHVEDLPEESVSEADESEDVRPSEQPQQPTPSKDLLSEKNLRIFNGDKEEMDPASNSRSASTRRSSSRHSTTVISEVTQDTTRTPRSSGTTAHYRYTHLADAEVYIHTEPPDDIQKAIDAIIKAKPSEERLAQLKTISQVFYKGCAKAVQAAIGEDDFVDLFLDALKAMNHDNICLRAKADWREELKPKTQQSGLNLNFLDVNFMAVHQQQEVENTSSPPWKRQRQFASQSYMSPRTSSNDVADSMPPPAPLERGADRSPIKTPRPDISIGIQHRNLISALSSQDLNNTMAKQFIAELQKKMVCRERDGSQEPMLISIPAPRASDLVHPFGAVESKAYSTGKQVFEVQSQAAVSAACGLKMQLCLNELADGATSCSDSLIDRPPLFFTFCTEGPYCELWAHFTEFEDGVRKFHQKLLGICHGLLLGTVDDFFVVTDNVLRWGTGPFLDSVVERLGKVARKANT